MQKIPKKLHFTAPHSSLILLTEIKSRLLFKFTTATGYSYTHSLSWRVHVTSFTWIWTWSESEIEIGNWMSSWTGICKTRASTKTHHKFPIFLKVEDILMKTQEQSLSNDKCLKKERSALTFFRQNIYLIIIEVCFLYIKTFCFIFKPFPSCVKGMNYLKL